MAAREQNARRLRTIVELLKDSGPAVRPGLDHGNPWELLVATVLSAQCTDARVNQVTPALFRRYPDPAALAAADVREVEALIHSIGIFRGKARSLVGLAGILVREHSGRVPADRTALERLPGVGRKTASVILGQAFGIPAFPVDTHVGRVCERLGFAPSREPREVEDRVAALLDRSAWVRAHLLLIRHGRQTCTARSPRCPVCVIRAHCSWLGKSV